MPATRFFNKYMNRFFVETGSFFGDGIEQALDAGFEHVVSIELSDKYFNLCRKRFASSPRVTLHQGDSAFVLFDVIRDLDEPITFWLDGHHSCGDTALGAHWAPLMQELDQIARHPIKNHTVLIDDMRCWELPNETHGFFKDDIFARLERINPQHRLSYEDGEVPNDVLVVQFGIPER